MFVIGLWSSDLDLNFHYQLTHQDNRENTGIPKVKATSFSCRKRVSGPFCGWTHQLLESFHKQFTHWVGKVRHYNLGVSDAAMMAFGSIWAQGHSGLDSVPSRFASSRSPAPRWRHRAGSAGAPSAEGCSHRGREPGVVPTQRKSRDVTSDRPIVRVTGVNEEVMRGRTGSSRRGERKWAVWRDSWE